MGSGVSQANLLLLSHKIIINRRFLKRNPADKSTKRTNWGRSHNLVGKGKYTISKTF